MEALGANPDWHHGNQILGAREDEHVLFVVVGWEPLLGLPRDRRDREAPT